MKIRRKKIRELVEDLLKDNNILQPFIPVDLVAEKMGIKVEYQNFDDQNLSGCILRNGASALICVNSNESKNRQRFTIAHEIGHFMLHREDEGFVDKGLNRNLESSKATDPKEIEANHFAAELLMPKEFIEKDVEAVEVSDYDDFIKSLAARYEVSAHAMTLRLNYLGYISS